MLHFSWPLPSPCAACTAYTLLCFSSEVDIDECMADLHYYINWSDDIAPTNTFIVTRNCKIWKKNKKTNNLENVLLDMKKGQTENNCWFAFGLVSLVFIQGLVRAGRALSSNRWGSSMAANTVKLKKWILLGLCSITYSQPSRHWSKPWRLYTLTMLMKKIMWDFFFFFKNGRDSQQNFKRYH